MIATIYYFNKTFLHASRLEVEYAFQYGANEKPRAWSKYTQGTSAHRRLEATGANTIALGEKERGKGKKKKEPKPEEGQLIDKITPSHLTRYIDLLDNEYTLNILY